MKRPPLAVSHRRTPIDDGAVIQIRVRIDSRTTFGEQYYSRFVCTSPGFRTKNRRYKNIRERVEIRVARSVCRSLRVRYSLGRVGKVE